MPLDTRWGGGNHKEVPKRRRGIFSGKKQALEDENRRLREMLEATGMLSAFELEKRTQGLSEHTEILRAEVNDLERRARKARADLIEIDDVAQMQEAGVYQYAHPLENSVEYKERLKELKQATRDAIKGGNAVSASTDWTVNNSAAKGRKMVRDFSKLLLRAYNAEADNCVRTVKPATLLRSLDRLEKTAKTITRLGSTMDIKITSAYHKLKLKEIELTADYLAKVAEEKERARAERERLRDEAAAAREIEREKTRLAKEQAHYENALARALEENLPSHEVEELKSKLSEIGGEMDKIVSRAANIRAGWVYVISNIGSFGENMVKIGLTRRLEPMDRVRELGDASVPFRFDVHALIFSEDAVSLETSLHQALADRKVNAANNAREFFFVTPGRVKELLTEMQGTHLIEYKEEPEAAEWRASGARRATDFTFD